MALSTDTENLSVKYARNCFLLYAAISTTNFTYSDIALY
jgi:hypothetical protein